MELKRKEKRMESTARESNYNISKTQSAPANLL